MIDTTKRITLDGTIVSLEPLELKHRRALVQAANDGELWRLNVTFVPSEATIDQYLETAFTQVKYGTSFPFVVIDQKPRTIIGTTRFLNIDHQNRRVEIGSTWYSKSYHRTGVNTECKYLLLRHAFEVFNCIAVEFRTHHQNDASQKAILRLGAKQDGRLRNHRICPDGSLRDSYVYSIIRSEWEGVKASLIQKINAY